MFAYRPGARLPFCKREQGRVGRAGLVRMDDAFAPPRVARAPWMMGFIGSVARGLSLSEAVTPTA